MVENRRLALHPPLMERYVLNRKSHPCEMAFPERFFRKGPMDIRLTGHARDKKLSSKFARTANGTLFHRLPFVCISEPSSEIPEVHRRVLDKDRYDRAAY